MSRKHVDLDDLENVDEVDDIEELDDLDMEDMPSLFWNLTITPGKETPIEDPGVGFIIHITNACFGASVTKDSRTVVMCKVEDKEVPICVLREGSYENHQLDLLFSDPASFVLKGNKPSAVVLTGYLQPDAPNLGGMGGPDSLMGDEFNMDDIDDEELASAIKGKLGKSNIDEDEDEDAPQLLDESDASPQSKKSNNNQKENKNKKGQQKPNKKGQQGQQEKVEQKEEKSSNDTPVGNKDNDDKDADKNKDKNKMIKMKNGIQYKDMKEGTGAEIKNGQQVSIYYVGQDSSAKVFDKKLSGEGFKFHFGKGEVIKGWDLGLKGMKVGGKRKLIIPARFAYGKEGTENIKPNEDLTFTVEIKNIS